jgi:glutamyl-tRNA reductase
VLAETDLLVTCTGSGDVVLDHELVAAAAQMRRTPLLIVDVAVPRDVAADVAELDGVTLLNLDDLRDWAAHGVRHRADAAHEVRAIVADEVERFGVEAMARQAAPLVAQLHELAEALRSAELARHARKLNSLTDSERAAVEAITRGVTAKLLHQVSTRLKADAGTPQGERNAAAVRELFGLE